MARTVVCSRCGRQRETSLPDGEWRCPQCHELSTAGHTFESPSPVRSPSPASNGPAARQERKARPDLGQLVAAAARGDVEGVRALLDADADANGADEAGLTPLHAAAGARGDDAALCELLIQYGARVDVRDRDGWTPLHSAAVQGNRRVAELLLSKGADRNPGPDTVGSPSLVAQLNGHEELARFLSEAGGGTGRSGQR